MHHARIFDIPEILLSICQEITHSSPSLTEARHSLLSLALSSRGFQELALNEIWKEQTSLLPLLKCFPTDTWDIYINDSDDDSLPESIHNFVFTRHLEEDDWSRVLFYSRRIKRLLEGQLAWLPQEIGYILAASLPPTTRFLLPELQELRCPPADFAYQFIRLLLPPTIRSFKIAMGGLHALRLSCFCNMPKLCPALDTLEITRTFDVDFVELKGTLPSFRSLRHLKLYSATTESIEWVARHLVGLTHLTLECSAREKPVSFSLPTDSLPNLLHLRLLFFKMKASAQALSNIASTRLEHIEISPRAASSEEQWMDLCCAIKPFGRSLRFLKINECTQTSQSEHTITRKGFEHIFALSNVSQVHFLTNANLDIRDDFLRDLSRHCPILQNLTIWSHHPSSRIRLNLNTLANLLQHCPQLYRVKLELDARTIPPMPVLGEKGSPVINRAMESLSLGGSPINDTVKVAAFLHFLCPKLQRVDATRPPAKYQSLWRQTQLHLRTIKEVQSYNP